MKWRNIPEDISEYQGFVYQIRHKETGRYYIGRKYFWNKKTLPPLKGRKNKRHFRVESDWKTYWGSSKKFLEYVKQEGKRNFERAILKCCFTKWDCAYDELIFQLESNVLFDEKAFNEIINVRLRKRK